MSFKQPELPYDLGALNPFVSEEQMSFHYGKHHAAYFTNLNGLVDGKPESDLALRKVVVESQGPVFNNSAQAWNHSFFWHCMAPGGGGAPQGEIKGLIEAQWGTFDKFKEEFSTAAAKLFGSGWAWLAADPSGKLEILPLSNADTPLRHGKEPVLTLDVWEHAYYIDYRNARPKFIEGFWDVVNWDFVNRTLKAPFQE